MKVCTVLATALLAGCIPALAQDLNVREFRRTVDARQVTVVDRLPWYAGESVGYVVVSRRGDDPVEIPEGSVPVWTVIDSATNAYVVATGTVVSATNGEVRFWLPAPQANLPPGNYNSYATVYQGTNRIGVLDRATVSVSWRPGDDFESTQPLTNVLDQVAGWFADAAGLVALASNSFVAAIAAETQAREEAGYLTAETDPDFAAWLLTDPLAGYLTAETDPAFAAAPAYGITTDLIAAWNLAYGWGNHASAGYLTNESDPAGIAALGMFSNSVFSIMNDMSSDIIYAVSLAEGASTGSEPLWTAASNSVLYVGDVADVAYGTETNTAFRGDWGASVSNLAASAVQDGDSIAALTVTSLMANGDLTELGRDVKGRDAGSVGTFGAAFGGGTAAGDYGAAFGSGTAAGDYGAAFGYGTAAAFGGAAFGGGTAAGDYGAAFGSGTAAGDYGAAFGVQNRGGSNSFIFSDHDDDVYFDRTNFPCTFNARVKGGVHFLIGTNWLTATNDAQTNLVLSVPGTVSAGSFAFGDGDAITNWPRGDVLGATINPPHTVATNDGLLAFTIGATGSGFPLTNDVSAAGFSLEQVGLLSASSVRAATDVYATNDVSARDLYARRNLDVAGNGVVDGNLVVSGNFTLIGAATNLNWVTVDNRTNVYGGTNYYETTVYATNVVYQKTIVYTNIITTNNVTTYVTQNGQWNATNAEYAWFPHLRDYRDGNAEAIGTWDFADASVSNLYLPPDAIQTASIAALADGVATIDLGSNWCWRLDASGDITAINFSTAGLKEGAMNANSVKGILLEVSRGSEANWAWGGHLSHITNTAPPADAVSHLLLIGPSQDVTGTNGWAVY